MKHPVICIVGPTGVGKTPLSIAISKHFKSEIINADAFQVYIGMDIGTAKVTSDEMQGVPHHLLSYVPVNENYDVSRYQKDVRKAVENQHEKGQIPILVGGTGLYLKAALYDYDFTLDDHSIKLEIEDMKELSDEEVHRLLKEVDPEDAALLHANNRRRVERSLAMFRVSGLTKKMRQTAQPIERYDVIWIGLRMQRELLWKRQDARAERMFIEGLMDEVTELFGPDYSRTSTASQAIGYKELFPYLRGETSLESAKEQIKIRTHQFTKRQFTWFTHQMPVMWFDVNPDDFSTTVADVIAHIHKRVT